MNRVDEQRARLPMAALMLCLVAAVWWPAPVHAQAQGAAALRFAVARTPSALASQTFDGHIEAVRDAKVAAQVAGRITQVMVKAGDKVQAGQVLMSIDPAVAAQQVAGSRAQVAQAEAMLSSARAELDRTRRLREQNYVSQAALDQALAQFKAAQAQANALSAQASATTVQAGFYTVRSPYAGWVAQVQVSVGDMASPGLQLASVYDPTALRATAQVPESLVNRMDPSQPAEVEFSGGAMGPGTQVAVKTTVLPSVDTATHSATVRLDLKPQSPGVLPGQFVRVRLPVKAPVATDGGRVLVPQAAVVERSEMTGVYVITANGQVLLRQVRVGRAAGDQVEILAGVAPGEKVALDVVGAARLAH
jgi:membrane fusion protein, multidrug efflux system